MFSPKSLGYDRSLTIFSPDGRLFQVEYANEAVRRGASCLALTGTDGIVALAQKKSDQSQSKLLVGHGHSKIYQIDDHILLTGAGLLGDLQWVVSYARFQAQQMRLTYGEPAGIESLVRALANLFLLHTQVAGYRPFGVSTLVFGVRYGQGLLFLIEPSGAFYQYNAAVLGEGM
ncbi:MAG TPA: proteasome subunit alpha, partial [Candidatus Hodarchaeales archaeon]|nr:proteasome subunit alpha [Candidatus Hodarchaeales archaeon]